METQIILATLIISFGSISVLPNILTPASADVSKINGTSELQSNFRSLFDSIARNDLGKTGDYRQLLEEEAVQELQAFDSMKEEMRSVRQKQRMARFDYDTATRKLVGKRETSQHDGRPDKTYDDDDDYELSDEETESGQKKVTYSDIFEAADKNDLEGVKHFVEVEGIKVTITNRDRQTIAHVAAKNANLAILKYAIAQNRTVMKMEDRWDQRILHQAVNASALDIVKYLVEQCKVSPLIPKNIVFGDNCVHIAAMQGRLEVLKYLLEKRKFDPNMRNMLGEPPMMIAAERGHLEIVKYLLETHRADPTQLDQNQGNILYHSAQRDDVEVPKYLLDEKKVPLDVNWQDLFGQTAIFRAVRFDALKFIAYMVEEKKADMNITDKLGRTPLMEAVSEDKLAVVKYFLEKGAKADIDELMKLAMGKAVQKYLESRAPSQC